MQTEVPRQSRHGAIHCVGIGRRSSSFFTSRDLAVRTDCRGFFLREVYPVAPNLAMRFDGALLDSDLNDPKVDHHLKDTLRSTYNYGVVNRASRTK